MFNFSHCQTQEEAKTLYRQLARECHPDLGGNTEEMQKLNAEYANFCANFAHRDARARQQTAHASGKKSAADYHDLDAVIEALKAKIEAVLNLGLDVELCGLWAWVSGDTKPHKEELKALEFRWSPDKKLWYFAGVPSFNRSHRSMDYIRSKHGSTKYTHREEERAGLPA